MGMIAIFCFWPIIIVLIPPISAAKFGFDSSSENRIGTVSDSPSKI